MVSIVFSNDFGVKVIDNKIQCCWSCEVTKEPCCVSCGEITFISKVFYYFLCQQSGLLVGDHICMFYIQLRHDHFGWEVWDCILPWCLQGWPIQVLKHIHSHFCCWREWWDKSLINKCKWNDHRLWKWRCWEGAWMWWDKQLVCKFLLFNWLDFRRRWIVQCKDLLFVIKNLHRCEGWLVYCFFVIGLDG